MQYFDETIINWLNQSFLHNGIFTSLMLLIWDNNLVKGGALIALLWCLWFSDKNYKPNMRAQMISSIIACIVAIIVARALALGLPFRARPFLNPNLFFPTHLDIGIEKWSSFPSDHAVMFFSLATGIFLISRKLGILAYTYVLLFICFPRIFLGLHYPTDILVGALIGVFITWLISFPRISQPLTRRILEFSLKYPGIFYALFFLLSFQIAILFDDSRHIVSYMFNQLHKVF
jgi:undecaprenyl-diphosphatase